MTPEKFRGMLLWSAIINYSLLIAWVLIILLAPEPLRRIGRLFGVSGELLDALNYGGILLYKLGIFLFNLVPYIALRIVR